MKHVEATTILTRADIADAVFILTYLFASGPAPPASMPLTPTTTGLWISPMPSRS